MTVTGVLAQSTVSDLEAAEKWYSTVLGAGPDARPMDGLLEWHFAESHGLQVFAEPERAGHSSTVLAVADLDGLAQRLTAAGIDHDGPEPVTTSRILRLSDPDGNRVIFAGT